VLLAAQVEAESGFDAHAVSAAGALGAAQFMPATWAGSWNPYREHSPFEPRFAVLAQARYLHGLVERAGGDVPRALAAYNAGWAGSAGAWPGETTAYVAQIMRRFGGVGALTPVRLAGAVSDGSGLTRVRLLPTGTRCAIGSCRTGRGGA
jgi:soluble lytic murein transglycosylase-like protein